MQKFAKALKTMAMMIINTPQNSMIPLTDEENRKYERSIKCHICSQKFIHDKERRNIGNIVK